MRSDDERNLPVLVEPPLGLLADVLGPDGLEGAHAAGSLDVSDHSDADHGRSLEDGDGLHHLLLVDLGAGSVHLPDDVSHARLVSQKSGHVDWLGGVIFGESLALAHVTFRPLLREEPLGSVSRRLKLSVRLKKRDIEDCIMYK